MSDFLGEEEQRYARRFIRPAESAITYASIRDIDGKVLSESDREALEFAWNRFGRTAEFTLSKLTHRYPDWKKHEPALVSKTVSRAPMNYRDFLQDPPPGVDPCYELDAETREAVASGIDELAAFEKLWR
jgi:hypothetical protein